MNTSNISSRRLRYSITFKPIFRRKLLAFETPKMYDYLGKIDSVK